MKFLSLYRVYLYSYTDKGIFLGQKLQVRVFCISRATFCQLIIYQWTFVGFYPLHDTSHIIDPKPFSTRYRRTPVENEEQTSAAVCLLARTSCKEHFAPDPRAVCSMIPALYSAVGLRNRAMFVFGEAVGACWCLFGFGIPSVSQHNLNIDQGQQQLGLFWENV